MRIHELRNPIAVKTPLGDAKCIAWLDYGFDVNTVWKCRIDATGKVRNFYDDDIVVYPNLMNGEPELQKEETPIVDPNLSEPKIKNWHDFNFGVRAIQNKLFYGQDMLDSSEFLKLLKEYKEDNAYGANDIRAYIRRYFFSIPPKQ